MIYAVPVILAVISWVMLVSLLVYAIASRYIDENNNYNLDIIAVISSLAVGAIVVLPLILYYYVF